jgi:glycosyltransferase involved in cell wall biosynthesis
MQILFLTQVLPYPLDAGPKIRAYYVLRHLAERGHEVTLVSFVRGDNTQGQVAHLEGFCRAVHTVPMCRSRARDVRFLAQSLLTGQSFIIVRDTEATMQRLVGRLLDKENFDVIHADQLWMAQYARDCNKVKRVLDQHNAVYLIPQRLAQCEGNPLKRLLLEREWRALARYEADVCQRFDWVVTVTEEDRQLLLHLYSNDNAPFTTQSGNSQTSVIPICVDPDEKPLMKRRPAVNRILILGTMFWLPNVEGTLWFAQEVLPLVLREVPDATLTIIGKNSPQSIRQLAESPGSNVEATGYVEDLILYLEESAVFVVPLHAGGGMRVKILDAWCWGIPIVSTTIGAEGIEVRNGENILIADAPEEFARAVVSVMKDPALARQLRSNGRKWVEQKYNWRTVYRKWDEVYER